MYSQCPRCRTIFMLSPAQLAAARGNTVCGHCGTLFNSLASLSEFPPDADTDLLEEHPQDLPAPALHLPIVAPALDPVATFDPDPIGKDDSDASDVGPVFVPAAPKREVRDARWWGVAVALLVVLIVQLAWANRGALLQDSFSHQVLQGTCRLFGCQPPLPQDVAALSLISREIRPHPTVPGALQIMATIRNDAPYTQRYPHLRIRLADLQERPVAMRRFSPADYLMDIDDARRGLAAQATAVLVFEVADPGREAVAFEFGFD